MVHEIPCDAFWAKVLERAKTGLNIIAGAGVSAIPPVSLPMFGQLTEMITDAYLSYGRAIGLIGKEIAIQDKLLLGLGGERRDMRNISPDFALMHATIASYPRVSEFIAGVFRTTGFTTAHSLVVNLLMANQSNVLVSVNFDNAFENCLAYHQNTDAVEIVIGAPSTKIKEISSKRLMFKAHGCVSTPRSLVYTLQEEFRQVGEWIPIPGLGSISVSAAWMSLMHEIAKRPILVIGYSGRDNFFPFLTNLPQDKEIWWLSRGEFPRDGCFSAWHKTQTGNPGELFFTKGDLRSICSFSGLALPSKEPVIKRYPTDLFDQEFNLEAATSLMGLMAYLLPKTANILFPVLREKLGADVRLPATFLIVELMVKRHVGDRNDIAKYLERILPSLDTDSGIYLWMATHLGMSYSDRGEYKRAWHILRRLQDLDRPVPNSLLAQNAFHLGEMYHWSSNFEEADHWYQKAAELAKRDGLLYLQASILNSQGNQHRALGKLDQAVACLEESLMIKRQLGDLRAIANTVNNLGTVYMNEESGWARAEELLRESLGIKESIQDEAGLCSAWTNLGSLLSTWENQQKQRNCLGKALR